MVGERLDGNDTEQTSALRGGENGARWFEEKKQNQGKKRKRTIVVSETGKTIEKKMQRTPWDEEGKEKETSEEANSRQNKKMIKIGDMCGSKTKHSTKENRVYDYLLAHRSILDLIAEDDGPE